jgi:hypothetical protein
MAKKRKRTKRSGGKTRTANRKKKTEKGKARKKGSARRTRAGARKTASVAAAAGTCLDLIAAGEIVQDAIPGGPHDIDSTLEDAGLITAGQRTIFREDVVDGVSARGCTIDPGDVPSSATTTLRDARRAVHQNAG